MTPFAGSSFSVAEAACIVGLSERAVHQEIDHKIIRIEGIKGERLMTGTDLLYLGAVKDLRTSLGTSLRRRIRQTIGDAARDNERLAVVSHFSLDLDHIERKLVGSLEHLQHIRRDVIEIRPDILAGEPVVKGTRIAVHHIADLMRQGARADEIADELDLTAEQVEAAVIYDRASPRRGRPVTRKPRTTHVSPAG